MSDPTPGRPSKRLLAVAGVVAVVVAGAIAFTVVATRPAAIPVAPPSTAAAPVAAGAGADAAGQASVCGLPGYDGPGSTLTAAPAARWSIVGTMAAPAAARLGPGRITTSGLRSCYAHTVAGALFAMANIWAMGTDPRLSQLLLERQTADGPGRDAALQASIPPSNTGLRAQIVGFRVTSYTGDGVTVDLAFQLSNGDLVSVPGPLLWQDGDWKLQPADTGQPVFGAAALTSLAGYVPWTAGP